METNDRIIESNQVEITGEIVSNFKFSHEVMSEGFYLANVAVERTSGEKDIIPIMVSDRLIDVEADWTGRFVKISGNFRSFNNHEGEKSHLILSVFVRDIEVWGDDGAEMPGYEDRIYLDGYICKQPVYRKTPLGREIADIFLAVNRPYGKSDYIPCICWGRNARFSSGLEVGARLKVCGRIQSREYQKKISDDEYEIRTAYEASVSKLEVVEETEE